jgi:folate-binding protein YgfZ
MAQTLLWADRSERGKLRLTGPQRAWFLHQILTQNFEDIEPGDARAATLLTAHGRMVGYMEVVATDEELLMHFEPELIDSLPSAIQFYVLATDVKIEDVTDHMGLLLVAGKGAKAVVDSLGPAVVVHPTDELGIEAFYLWVERAHLGVVAAAVSDAGANPATEEQLEAIRIGNGVPRWGREMDDKTFPQEVAIDERAVHYDKGCYVGQEAMAKIHLRGKVNRRLRTLQSDDALQPGVELTTVDDDAKVGVVTSWLGTQGLGMLRYTIYPGDLVSAGDHKVKVTG